MTASSSRLMASIHSFSCSVSSCLTACSAARTRSARGARERLAVTPLLYAVHYEPSGDHRHSGHHESALPHPHTTRRISPAISVELFAFPIRRLTPDSPINAGNNAPRLSFPIRHISPSVKYCGKIMPNMPSLCNVSFLGLKPHGGADQAGTRRKSGHTPRIRVHSSLRFF